MIPVGDERTPDGGEVAAERPAREQLMTVQSQYREEAVIVTVQGVIDGHTAPRIRKAIEAGFDRLGAHQPLIVDLAEVRFLGSAGLHVLFDAAAEAVQRRGFEPLRVVVDHTRPVIRPIEIVGLDGMLALYHTVDEALAG